MMGSRKKKTEEACGVREQTPPMKGSGIRKPNRARLGIVCITLAMPRTGPRNFWRREIRMPTGSAMATAIAIEMKTSQRCCAICVRMSDQLALRNSSIKSSADYADTQISQKRNSATKRHKRHKKEKVSALLEILSR